MLTKRLSIETVALDGLFTPILTNFLLEKGLSLTDILLKVRNEVYHASGGLQIPGEYNQLLINVYLNGKNTNQSENKSIFTTKNQPLKSSFIEMLRNINFKDFNTFVLNNYNVIYDARGFIDIRKKWAFSMGGDIKASDKIIFANNNEFPSAAISHGPISIDSIVLFSFTTKESPILNINIEGSDDKGRNDIIFISTDGTYFKLNHTNSFNYGIVDNIDWEYSDLRYLPNKQYITVFQYDKNG
ncbi:hypothetical protein [Gracilinema caldarium]|uniref:hypothetical protein n=1 Tax=Gracilinema caldarium TaxID=215591 RepID=UPI0026EE8CBC|nr:hypothetical protein [Gracilinema caldarium]